MIRREDMRTVLFALAGIPLLLIPYFWSLGIILGFVYIALFSFYCFILFNINHNHGHKKIYRDEFSNRLFDHLITAIKGGTASGVLYTHNINHHKYHGGEKDWMPTSIVDDIEGEGKKTFHYFFRAIKIAKNKKIILRNCSSYQQYEKRASQERVTLIVTAILLLAFNYKVFLLLTLPSWFLSQFLALSANYLDHVNRKANNAVESSNNFTGKVINWFIFNGGYHSAHHHLPNAHWADLPQIHAQIRSSLAPNSEFPDLGKFLLNHYFPKETLPNRSLSKV